MHLENIPSASGPQALPASIWSIVSKSVPVSILTVRKILYCKNSYIPVFGILKSTNIGHELYCIIPASGIRTILAFE
jgi:hypothetical protein